MGTRKELTQALVQRYHSAPRSERSVIPDEFAELTQYHRKHAIRVLNRRDSRRIPVVTRSRLYDEVVRQALVLLWEASDCLCGKRLKALIPMLIDAMHRHDHIDLDPAVRTKLPSMSAATLDRALRATRVAMPTRNQLLVVQAMSKVAIEAPFAMLGVDTDNDTAFMNQRVFDYCKELDIEQTRSRAYKKNDQAWVEQKNGAIVRRLVGYGRLSGRAETAALAALYAVSRLYINFFQPSFKLKSKIRDGARVRKTYHPPMTRAIGCSRCPTWLNRLKQG